ncbi:hypothetical protein R3P38DRAFT_3195990 [Favolaschia claudopus]|uniref:GATA-type domain-containing protein n=1 Tax=Favolaschia claudopus TaxID=2862362 RepID=A0AAW0BAR6_9AGAR
MLLSNPGTHLSPISLQHMLDIEEDQHASFTALPTDTAHGQSIPASENSFSLPYQHLAAGYASTDFALPQIPQSTQTMSGPENSFSPFDPFAGTHHHSALVSDPNFSHPSSHDGPTISSRFPASPFIPMYHDDFRTLNAARNSNFVGDTPDSPYLINAMFSPAYPAPIAIPRVGAGTSPDAHHQAFCRRLIQTMSEQNIDFHNVVTSMLSSGRLDASRLQEFLSRGNGGQYTSTAFSRRRYRNTPRKERRCFHCGTEETTQWRKHPQNGMVLCNRCGQKAYRAQSRNS